jgi:hypothetical protein
MKRNILFIAVNFIILTTVSAQGVPSLQDLLDLDKYQTVAEYLYEDSGEYGDERSYKIELADEIFYYCYICKYTLKAGDVLVITNDCGSDYLFRISDEQDKAKTLFYADLQKTKIAFTAETDGVYYVRIYKADEETANYNFKIQWYGSIENFNFAGELNITEEMSEDDIKTELGKLRITGTDTYSQEISFYSTLDSQWHIDMENRKATFTPILMLSFADIEFPLAERVDNVVYFSITTALNQTSAEKEILKEEYFGIDGKLVRATTIPPLQIKRTVYTDGTVKVEKVITR